MKAIVWVDTRGVPADELRTGSFLRNSGLLLSGLACVPGVGLDPDCSFPVAAVCAFTCDRAPCSYLSEPDALFTFALWLAFFR